MLHFGRTLKVYGLPGILDLCWRFSLFFYFRNCSGIFTAPLADPHEANLQCVGGFFCTPPAHEPQLQGQGFCYSGTGEDNLTFAITFGLKSGLGNETLQISGHEPRNFVSFPIRDRLVFQAIEYHGQ